MIEIRYGDQRGIHGVMRTDPAIWLQEKRSMRDFRKMLKLSLESDRAHGTNTVSDWETALLDEQNRIRRQAREILDAYKHFYNELRKKYDNPGIPYEAKREKLKKMDELLAQRKSVFDKQMKSLVGQMERAEKRIKLIKGAET